MPHDAELVRLAREGIEQLNRKYARSKLGRRHPISFYLFHRPRRWNAQEGVWMGYERKRGKLAEFNACCLRERREQRASSPSSPKSSAT